MDKHFLIMKWDYNYDKEGTWFDEDSGEEQYELKEGSVYTLPHIGKKSLEIRSVTAEGDIIKAEVYVDYRTYTVYSNGDCVVGHADYSYSAGGDSVSQSLCMKFSIK